MKLILSFIAIAILIGVIIKVTRARVTDTSRATVAQIGLVFESLLAAQAEPAFVVISFNTPDRPRATDAVDLQFYKENDRVGFDWVLESPRNLQDEERFLSFARDAGYAPRLMESHGVRHHRVDDGDVLRLCLAVITELYGLPTDSEIELVLEGFELKRS